MDTNGIIVEEVTEMKEEITKAGFGKGLKIGVGIGLAVLTGGVVYKYVAKPIVKKIKTKRQERNGFNDCFDLEDCVDVSEEN